MIGWIVVEAVWTLLILLLLAIVSSESAILMLRRSTAEPPGAVSSTDPVVHSGHTTRPDKGDLMVLTTHRRLIAVLMTIGLAFAFLMATSASTPAKANSTALTRVFNDTGNATIGVQFHTNYGTWATLNIGPHSWQGEVRGNTAYEPRSIHLGAGWCIDWHYTVPGHPAGGTARACGGSAGGWLNIYLGDSHTQDYDVHVTAVYPG
jgi:hypothetical protein